MKSVFALKYLLVFVLGIFLLSSCTMQKRKYRKGFYIDKHNSSQQANKPIKTISKEPIISKQTSSQSQELVCELKNDFKPYNKSLLTNKRLGLGRKVNQKCDTLFLKNGTIKVVSIVKIKESVVYYNNCGSTSNDDYFIPVNELSEIHYSDGRVIGRKEEAEKVSPVENEDKPYSRIDSDDDKAERIKVNNNIAAFLLLLSLLLAILMLFGMLQLYLVILPSLIAGIIISFVAKRRSDKIGDKELWRRANTILISSWLLLVAVTFIFALTVVYIWNNLVFVP